MQIVINDLSKFISLYVKACRARNCPDLYVVSTIEPLPINDGSTSSLSSGYDSDGNICVSHGQIVTNWSFLDDLLSMAVMYRHLEAKSGSEDFRSGDPNDTYIQLIAKIRTELMDRDLELSMSSVEEMLPNAYCGCVSEGLDHNITLSITDSNFEESKVVYAHSSEGQFE